LKQNGAITSTVTATSLKVQPNRNILWATKQMEAIDSFWIRQNSWATLNKIFNNERRLIHVSEKIEAALGIS
jgi:hypothetical protein